MMSPYLVGLLFGDGTSYSNEKRWIYSVWIDQHERNSDIAEKAKKELEKIGLNVHYYRHSNKIRAMVYSKLLYHEFKSIRSDPIKYFRNLKSKDKFEFISGFFDAEGTVTDRLVLYNGHIGLLKVIKSFIDNKLKITGHIYKFGKIYGIQIYKRDHIKLFSDNTNSIKISVRSSRLSNVRGC